MKFDNKRLGRRILAALGGLCLLGVVYVVAWRSEPSHIATVAAAESQLTFASAQQAGEALYAAASAQDQQQLELILGPEAKAILNSGDAEEDRAALKSFVAKYDRMNRWSAMMDGSQILYVGADNYPYPIPLVQNTSSRWYFDTEAGKDEVLARRIGTNELLAIDAISAMARAEEIYYKHRYGGGKSHQYAMLVLSTPGKKDGLYWVTSQGNPASPLGRLDEFAKDVASSTRRGEAPVFDGYSFRVLLAQGNNAKDRAQSFVDDGAKIKSYAILAAPVKYGDSGIMSFLVKGDGVVYEKDLGPQTVEIAKHMDRNDPDKSWTAAE
jgi:hypothetical protein